MVLHILNSLVMASPQLDTALQIWPYQHCVDRKVHFPQSVGNTLHNCGMNLASGHPPSCSLTSPPHQGRGRALRSRQRQRDHFTITVRKPHNVGKINLIYWQLQSLMVRKKTKAKTPSPFSPSFQAQLHSFIPNSSTSLAGGMGMGAVVTC